MKNPLLKAFFLLLFLHVYSSVSAEIIYLKDGKVIKGEVEEKTDSYIKVNVGGVSVPYFWREIKEIQDGSSQDEENQVVGTSSAVDSVSEFSAAARDPENGYVNEKFGFSLRMPPEWKKGDIRPPLQESFRLKVTPVNFYCQGAEPVPSVVVQVFTSSFPAEPRKMAELNIEDNKRLFGKRGIEFKSEEYLKSVDNDGMSYFRSSLSFDKFVIPPARELYGIKTTFYFFVRGETAVCITFLSHNDGRFEAEEREIIPYVHSFKFLD